MVRVAPGHSSTSVQLKPPPQLAQSSAIARANPDGSHRCQARILRQTRREGGEKSVTNSERGVHACEGENSMFIASYRRCQCTKVHCRHSPTARTCSCTRIGRRCPGVSRRGPEGSCSARVGGRS
eukprot:6667321-Prymnesium_polylepis.2